MHVKLFPERFKYFKEFARPLIFLGKSVSVSMLFLSTRCVRLVSSDPNASGIEHSTLLLRSSSARFFSSKREQGRVSRMLLYKSSL